jgi:hypothetical protein
MKTKVMIKKNPKLVLNILKVMGGPTHIYTSFKIHIFASTLSHMFL